MRALATSGLLAVLVAAGGPAFADDPARLDVKLTRNGNTILMTFDVTSAFTEEFRKRLSGGLTREVLMAMVLETSDGQAIVERARRCQLRLDVWDDVVYVRVSDGARVRRKTFPLIEDALRACGMFDRVPLVDDTLLRERNGYRLLLQVALNPVSEELREKSREFMSNPRGTSSGRPRAFFGAVARLFRAEEGAQADAFMFRSGPLSRPPRSSR